MMWLGDDEEGVDDRYTESRRTAKKRGVSL